MTDPQRKAARGPSQESGQGNDSFEDLVTLHDPTGAASEAYRMLRTSLFYAVVDTPPKVIVLTSPSSGEGKSTTTANLGVTLAQVGKSVLTLDQHSSMGEKSGEYGGR